MTTKIRLTKNHSEHIHIDNGGISISIEDRGDQGIYFTLAGEYFGYPAVRAEMQIDHYGTKFLDALEKVAMRTRPDLDSIDWDARYNNPSIKFRCPDCGSEVHPSKEESSWGNESGQHELTKYVCKGSDPHTFYKG